MEVTRKEVVEVLLIWQVEWNAGRAPIPDELLFDLVENQADYFMQLLAERKLDAERRRVK